MQSTELYKNPFKQKMTKESSKNNVSSRWANLDIGNDTEVSKNSFMRKNNDSEIFSNNNDKKSNFREPKRSSFFRYTKPAAPPPPKEFNMNEMESEFPALGN